MRVLPIIISFLSLGFISTPLIAQISVSPMNVESLKEAPFKYKGSRVMMGDRVDDATTQNIFLFTKPAKGVLPDTLFLQKYTKVDGVWKTMLVNEIVHNGAISLISNRKAFTDPDKDKSADVFFIYSLHNADASRQQSIHLLLVSKNEIYTISSSADSKSGPYSRNVFSANFDQLNVAVKEEVLKYWNTLKKD